MDIETGFFFITDITGFTRFLTQSELDHAKEILDAIFDSILEHLDPPLIISNTEGDAIFSYLPESQLNQKQVVIESMERIYFDFHHQLRLMQLNTTCACKACANMSGLDLKIFLHYGQYMLQQIGEKTDLQGPDVIMIHRLMKNSVREKFGLPGYGLLTAAAVEAIGLTDLVGELQPHVEEVEHFGEVQLYVYDLHRVWERESARSPQAVTREEAVACAEIFVPVSPWLAWDLALDVEVQRRILDLESHERTDAENTRISAGASYHCQHSLSDIEELLLEVEAPRTKTSRNHHLELGINFRITTEIRPAEGGSTVSVFYGMDDVAGYPDLPDAFQSSAEFYVKTFAKIVDEEIAAGRLTAEVAGESAASREKLLRPKAARFAEMV